MQLLTLVLCFSYAWILQDFLGMVFCMRMMKTIRLPHLKVSVYRSWLLCYHSYHLAGKTTKIWGIQSILGKRREIKEKMQVTIVDFLYNVENARPVFCVMIVFLNINISKHRKQIYTVD